MSRLNVPPPEEVAPEAQAVLDKVGAQFGFVPNMFRTLGSNPAVLDIVMTLQGKTRGFLDAKTRHTISLAVSQTNACDYCLAIHTYSSSKLGGMSDEDIALARSGSSIDAKRAAAARFAQRVVETRGQVSDEDIAAVREGGYTDPEILAIVTLSVVALLTNFINNVNTTEVDIPAPASAGSKA